MKAKLIVLVLAVLALPFSSAFSQEPKKGGFFIEPMVTYEKTDLKANYPAPFGSSEGDQKGLGVGARLGFHIYESVFIGVDGRYNKHDFTNDSDTEEDFKADADGHNYGLVVGFQLPTEISFRVWGTYIINGALDPEEQNGFDVKFEDAKGYRIGAGIMLGKVSLNVEYQDLTYEKAKLQSIGGFSPGTEFNSVELDSKGYIASISFPFSL